MNKTYEVPETKVCARCSIEKSVTEFNMHHAKIKGNSKYRGECKECQKLWRQENKDITAKAGILYRIRHADDIKKKREAYRSNPENREKNRVYAREYQKRKPEIQRIRLLAKYGITLEDYNILLANQNGCCAICGTVKNGKRMNFVIDHNHETGKVRGLLCTQCNAGIGNFKENLLSLSKAAEYLESFVK